MRVEFGSPFFQEITLEWAHGRCAWFALAASAWWTLPLVGFRNESGRLVHVACKTDHGVFDAYGLGSPEQVVAAFQRLGATEQMTPFEVPTAEVRAAFMLTEPEHEEEINDALYVCEQVRATLGIPELSYAGPRGSRP